jgi:leader peptidase (prepilin peptidase)/N-methyltransferase
MVTATDIHSMKIPNRISMSGAVLFLALGIHVDGKAWLEAVFGALVCSGLLYIIHLFTRGRGMGMGDVKLYISIGALLGPVLGLESLIVASALASAGAGVLMVTGRLQRREPFAFVPYIFAGVVLVSYMAPSFNLWYTGLVFG